MVTTNPFKPGTGTTPPALVGRQPLLDAPIRTAVYRIGSDGTRTRE